MNWILTNLRSISMGNAQYGANASAVDWKEDNPRYVRITDINDEGDLLDKDIRSLSLSNWAEFKLEWGDLLFARSGATVGKTFLYKPEYGLCAFAGYLIRFKLNKSLVDPKYVNYFTKTIMYKNWVLTKKRSAAQPNINGKEYSSLELHIPPLSEQRHIVEILDHADEIRKLRNQADEKAEKIIPAVFYEMFGDPATTDSNVKIKDIVRRVEQKDFRKLTEEKFKYIDISSIDGNKGKIISVSFFIGPKAPSRAKQIVKYNDVIISTVRPYLKATALIPEDLDNQVCSTGFCVLRTKNDFGFGFLYALSRLDWFSNSLMSMAKGASYPAVSTNDIMSLNIPYPIENEDLIKKFDGIIINLEHERNYREKSAQRVTDLFELLLSKAFDGSLTSSWREAHMKELLKEMEEQKKYLEKVS